MCLNSDWTPQVCWSPMGLQMHVGLRWGMSVFDGACRSPMEQVGLRWKMSVSDEACRSPMKHVEVSVQQCHKIGFFRTTEMCNAYKSYLSYPYIFSTWSCKPFIFQPKKNAKSNSLSLKHQRFTLSSSKYLGIKK